jgi:hypothetical protein
MKLISYLNSRFNVSEAAFFSAILTGNALAQVCPLTKPAKLAVMEVEESPDLQPWLSQLSDYEDRLEALIQTPMPGAESDAVREKAEAAARDMQQGPLSRQGIKDLIGPIVESWTAGLTALCREVMNRGYSVGVNAEELREIIHESASRIPYGHRDRKKDIYEDEDPLGYWTWQVDSNPPPASVLQERKLIGKAIQALYSLILSIKTKVTLMQSPKLVKITNLYDAYNKAVKKWDLFKAEREEKKRKREEIELEKTVKKQKLEQEKEEKKAKQAEERLLKAQQAELERKSKVEAEKKAKSDLQSAKKAAKEPTLSSPSQQQKTLSGYFSLERKPVQRPAYKWLFGPDLSLALPPSFDYHAQAVIPGVEEGVEGWKRYWKAEIRRLNPHKGKFIYHSDSALKPYWTGQKSATEDTIRRNPFRRYGEVDYEKDSDEEYEEMVRSL